MVVCCVYKPPFKGVKLNSQPVLNRAKNCVKKLFKNTLESKNHNLAVRNVRFFTQTRLINTQVLQLFVLGI